MTTYFDLFKNIERSRGHYNAFIAEKRKLYSANLEQAKKRIEEIQLLKDETSVEDTIKKFSTATFLYPMRVKFNLTSKFGKRTIFRNGKSESQFHQGIDIQTKGINTITGKDAQGNRTAIKAVAEGKVIDSRVFSASHSQVIIYHDKDEHERMPCFGGRSGYSIYFHLFPLDNILNKVVKKGENIGVEYNYAVTKAYHLHFELRTKTRSDFDWSKETAINPQRWVLSHGGKRNRYLV